MLEKESEIKIKWKKYETKNYNDPSLTEKGPGAAH
jgi:hypothetical protein